MHPTPERATRAASAAATNHRDRALRPPRVLPAPSSPPLPLRRRPMPPSSSCPPDQEAARPVASAPLDARHAPPRVRPLPVLVQPAPAPVHPEFLVLSRLPLAHILQCFERCLTNFQTPVLLTQSFDRPAQRGVSKRRRGAQSADHHVGDRVFVFADQVHVSLDVLLDVGTIEHLL